MGRRYSLFEIGDWGLGRGFGGAPTGRTYGRRLRRQKPARNDTGWEGEERVLVDKIPENMFINGSEAWKSMR